jgi:hypothetical protein
MLTYELKKSWKSTIASTGHSALESCVALTMLRAPTGFHAGGDRLAEGRIRGFCSAGRTKTPNPKPQTPNPKPQSRNPKLGTRNPNPESRNPNPESRIPRPEFRIPKPGTRNPKSETRNPIPQKFPTGRRVTLFPPEAGPSSGPEAGPSSQAVNEDDKERARAPAVPKLSHVLALGIQSVRADSVPD